MDPGILSPFAYKPIMPTLADLIIIIVIAFSATLGLRRGLIREGLSLSAWIIASLIALTMAPAISHGLANHVPDEGTRWLLAVLLIFTPALFGFSLANAYTTRRLPRSFSRYSQAFGVTLGAIRGLAILFLAIVLGRFSGLNRDLWWHESTLIHHTNTLIAHLEPYLPANLSPNWQHQPNPSFTRRLKLQADGQGTFHAQGHINHQPVDFRLDPTLKKTRLPTSMLEYLGLTKPSGEAQISLHSLRIGNLELTEVAMGLDPNASAGLIPLGQDVLQRLNFQGGTITLTLEQEASAP